MTACETTKPPIDFSFATFETIEAEVTHPQELPRLRDLECYPSAAECNVAGYSNTADVDTLELYSIRAAANTEIAEQNAIALDATIRKANAFVVAGRSQENITAILQDELAFEKEQRQRDRWYYRGLLALSAVAIVFIAE
jgi:hypothetical protein